MIPSRVCSRHAASAALLAGLALTLASEAPGRAPPAVSVSPTSEYTGASDASGAMAIGKDFFIVCDDEEGTLTVHKRNGGGAPVTKIDLGTWKELQVPGAKKELDLEAAAPLGDKVYWIGSHGNNKEGKVAPNRRQLFATTVTATSGKVRVVLVGQPYRRLVEDLVAAPALREFKLAEGAAGGRAPKDEGGLNVEGLVATPDGHLLLGFRNPVPQGRALIVPVLNPEEIIRGGRAALGAPICLDLGGRGIRDIIRVGREYFILAGDYGEADRRKIVTQLYRWEGPGSAPKEVVDFPKLNPEALIVYPDAAASGVELQVLSDDGRKPPLPVGKRTFRSVTVKL